MVIKTRTCESEMKKRVLITGSGQIGSYACSVGFKKALMFGV